jgi:poly(A) polymerase
VRNRVIRTIGEPRVRFREDPVRILRAAKFAGRLGFTIEPETFAAMAETAPDLVRAAPPRVLEEILRLLRGGHALPSFQLLRDVGALEFLVPVVADFLAQAPLAQRVSFWRLLDALDHQVQSGPTPSSGVLLATLMVNPVLAEAERQPERSPASIAEELLGPLSQTLRLPRRDSGCLKRVCGVQHRFLQEQDERRFRAVNFARGPYFEEALELFELRLLAGEGAPELADPWRQLASELRSGTVELGEHSGSDELEPGDRNEFGDGGEADPGRRRRRRRRRRRGGHDDDRADERSSTADGAASEDDAYEPDARSDGADGDATDGDATDGDDAPSPADDEVDEFRNPFEPATHQRDGDARQSGDGDD